LQHIPGKSGHGRVDGSVLTVEIAAGILPWNGSTGMQVVMRDITERRRV
jgi:PAS domain S-box-containing protein